MKNTRWLDKRIQIRFVSAQPQAVLNQLITTGVNIEDINFLEELVVQFWISAADMKTVDSLMRKNSSNYTVVGRSGVLWYINAMLKQPVLLIGLTAFLIVALWLPGRILFVSVEGNQTVPDKFILECVKECGVVFGSSRRTVRSEQTKNSLLAKIPQLQWVGINTSGCVAHISVKESSSRNPKPVNQPVSSIVATRDGVVERLVVLRGTALCKEGQSVKKGDVLISGYTDCGLKVTAEAALGEVYAHTNRELLVLAPKPTGYKMQTMAPKVTYRLKIGKKVINLYNDSGIPDGSCDKMYYEKFWSLPGGFLLPISIIKQISVPYKITENLPLNDIDQNVWLSNFADKYLTQQMIAGNIRSRVYSYKCEPDGDWLSAEYACLEMVGKVKYEETLQKDAEDN